MKYTIVCPIYNEIDYIENCIQSFINQTVFEDIEVLLVDGMSTDGTISIIDQYCEKYPNIRKIENPRRITPVSMNLGIKNATTDYILTLGAHSIYPNNYVEVLAEKIIELNADLVGGGLKSLPASTSILCKSIAILMSSPFGIGFSFRNGCNEIKKVNTISFGLYRKEIFEKVGYFDEELARGQDDELNARINQNGGLIYFIPGIDVRYYTRNSIIKFIKMFFTFGLYKPLINSKLKKPNSIRQFAPPLFVFLLFLGFILSFVIPKFYFLYLFCLAFYFSLGIYSSINSIQKIKDKIVFVLPALFFLVHFSYGIGYIKGYFQVKLNQKISFSINTR